MDERNRRILALLSHPSRVQLIELLGKKALQTDEMAAQMPIELAGTVVHLNYLINEGVVESKRFGRRVRYWLNRERFAEALTDLCGEVGIRVQVNRSFKQDAPSDADLPYWGSDTNKKKKKTPKTRTAAKKKAKKKPAKKKPAKKKTTKKKTTKKKVTKKKTTKKVRAKKAPAKRKTAKKKASKKRKR